MAVTTIAVAGLAVSAYGAKSQSDAGKKSAKATAGAAANANQENARQFDVTNANFAPFREAGVADLGRQNAFLDGDMSGFENNAGHKFALAQGLQAADRGAAAGAAYRSGGADADRMNYATGLATQTADNYWSKLAGRTGQAYNATNALASYGQNYAQGVGQNAFLVADARSSSYANSANAWANFGQNALRTGTSWARQQGYY